MFLRLITAFLLILAIGLPCTVMAEEEYWKYTFRPGDSLWKIAKKYTTSVNNWGEIHKINSIRLGSSQKILPGTRIVIPVSMLKLQPVPARVIALSGGEVKLMRADGGKGELTIGTLLYSGDQVITGDNQYLRMLFADNSELQVLPNSEVLLDKLSHHKQSGMVDTRIRLNSGSVNTQIEEQKTDSRYEIRTPAASTAVRGTTFRLSSDVSQISRTEVTDGIVDVSAGDAKKAVRDGFGIVAEKGKPLPDPIKLLPPPQVRKNLSSDRSKLQLLWDKLQGATYYRYQLATDEKFNLITIDATTSDNTIEMTGLPPGRYYLRVRGVDRHKLEGHDSVNNFVIQQNDGSIWNVIIPIGMLILIL